MKVENSQDAFTVCMVQFQRREWKQAGSAKSAGKQSHYCSPQTGRDCFAKHIEPGMPKKTYTKKAKKQLENTVALYINSCSFLF